MIILPGKPAQINDFPPDTITHFTFGLGGEDVDPEQVTFATGILPHLWYRIGDPYIGRISGHAQRRLRREAGRWALNSLQLTESKDPEDHIDAILNHVDGAKHIFYDLSLKTRNGVGGWITYAKYADDPSMGLAAKQVRRLAELGAWVSLRISILPGESPDDEDTQPVVDGSGND